MQIELCPTLLKTIRRFQFLHYKCLLVINEDRTIVSRLWLRRINNEMWRLVCNCGAFNENIFQDHHCAYGLWLYYDIRCVFINERLSLESFVQLIFKNVLCVGRNLQNFFFLFMYLKLVPFVVVYRYG